MTTPPSKFGSQFTPVQIGSNIRHCSDGSLGNDLFLMQKSSMLYYQLWASRTSSGRTFTGAHNRHSSTFPTVRSREIVSRARRIPF